MNYSSSDPLNSWKSRVNGKKRCSYSDKVDCDSREGAKNTTEESRLPKYKVTVTSPEYFNKSVEEICGKSVVEDMGGMGAPRPRGLRLPRRGRIINGTRALYARWPWQVGKGSKSFYSRGGLGQNYLFCFLGGLFEATFCTCNLHSVHCLYIFIR